MNLVFLGTGHWSSKSRRAFALYMQIAGTNLLFECPSHVPSSLREAQLPLPDAVLISHEHPGHCDHRALRELYHDRLHVGIRRGLNFGDVSVTSTQVRHGRVPTVGFAINHASKTVIVPDAEHIPDSLLIGASCVIVDAAFGDGLFHRHIPPSELQSQAITQCGVTQLLFTHVAEESNNQFLRIPKDGEVIEMAEQHTYRGVRLSPDQIGSLLRGVTNSIVLARPFEELVQQPVLLCGEDGVYARIVLAPPEQRTQDELDALLESHGLTRAERSRRWPGASSLFEFDVQVVDTFDTPVPASLPFGRVVYNDILLESGGASALTEAKWSTSYKNNLPDSAFLYIEPGGKKDKDGKTTPRSLRHLPVRDKDGKVALAQVRNAISRANQVKRKSGKRLSLQKVKALQTKARALLKKHRDDVQSMIDEVDEYLDESYDPSSVQGFSNSVRKAFYYTFNRYGSDVRPVEVDGARRYFYPIDILQGHPQFGDSLIVTDDLETFTVKYAKSDQLPGWTFEPFSEWRSVYRTWALDEGEAGGRLNEVIKTEGSKVVLYAKDGKKVLGRFEFGKGKKYANEKAARAAAHKREGQIAKFKEAIDVTDGDSSVSTAWSLDEGLNIQVTFAPDS